MTSSVFKVSEYYELVALHRALLESQFCDEPNDTDVSASPIIAKLHKQLLESIVALEIERKGLEAESAWSDWLQIDAERREWTVALKRANRETRWNEWDFKEKKDYVYDLLSPFKVSDDLVEEFISQV